MFAQQVCPKKDIITNSFKQKLCKLVHYMCLSALEKLFNFLRKKCKRRWVWNSESKYFFILQLRVYQGNFINIKLNLNSFGWDYKALARNDLMIIIYMVVVHNNVTTQIFSQKSSYYIIPSSLLRQETFLNDLH